MKEFCWNALHSYCGIKDSLFLLKNWSFCKFLAVLCKFWWWWTLAISGRNDEIAYLLQWMHSKSLQFKQVLGSTQCCSNYTKKDSIWSGEWTECVASPKAWSTWLSNKFKGNSCEKWQMARVTEGCVSVYVFVIIDAAFSGFLFFFFLSFLFFLENLKDDLLQLEPCPDMWSGICTRHTADTKYYCVSARFLTVCVMSKLQYLIWTTCRKLKSIKGYKTGTI